MRSADADTEQATDTRRLAGPFRLILELAQASVMVIAFAVAIVIVGTPIAMAVRVLHAVALWLLSRL
jgi:hypothetical protein